MIVGVRLPNNGNRILAMKTKTIFSGLARLRRNRRGRGRSGRRGAGRCAILCAKPAAAVAAGGRAGAAGRGMGMAGRLLALEWLSLVLGGGTLGITRAAPVSAARPTRAGAPPGLPRTARLEHCGRL